MTETLEAGKYFQREVYRDIEEIAEGLLDESTEKLSEALNQEYGVTGYPIETDFESGNDYMRAGFGLSGLLAQEYSSPDDMFFDNRDDDFREFIQDIGSFESGYEKTHLVQYAQLYSGIAEEEGLEKDYPVETLIIRDLDEIRVSVKDMLDDLAEEV